MGLHIEIGKTYAQVQERTKETKIKINKLVGTAIASADGRPTHLLVKKIHPKVKVTTESGVHEGLLKSIQGDTIILKNENETHIINGYTSIVYYSEADFSEVEAVDLDSAFLVGEVIYRYRTKSITWSPKIIHVLESNKITTVLFAVIESEFERTIPGASLIANQAPKEAESLQVRAMKMATQDSQEDSHEVSSLTYTTKSKIYPGVNVFALSKPITTEYEHYYLMDLVTGLQEATKEITYTANINFPEALHEFTTESGLVFDVEKEESRKDSRVRQSVGRTAEITADVVVGLEKRPKETRRMVNIKISLTSRVPGVIYLRYNIGESQVLQVKADYPNFFRDSYIYFEIQPFQGKVYKEILLELS